MNVRRFCKGHVLDIGCGPGDIFNRYFLNGNGQSVDFHDYEGLKASQVIKDPKKFPFTDANFDTVTLIANINHIPKSVFEDEIKEIGRVLKKDGELVMTRIGLVVSFLTHNWVKVQSAVSKEYYDMDSDRGMEEDERYTVSLEEIESACKKAGLTYQGTHKIWTQWALNEILIFKKVQ